MSTFLLNGSPMLLFGIGFAIAFIIGGYLLSRIAHGWIKHIARALIFTLFVAHVPVGPELRFMPVYVILGWALVDHEALTYLLNEVLFSLTFWPMSGIISAISLTLLFSWLIENRKHGRSQIDG